MAEKLEAFGNLPYEGAPQSPCQNGKCLGVKIEMNELAKKKLEESSSIVYRVPQIGPIIKNIRMVRLDSILERQHFAVPYCQSRCLWKNSGESVHG